MNRLPDNVKHDLLYEDAHTMPANDDQLHEYIQAYMGFYIPRVNVCQEHVAPFSLIADVFFERERNVLVLASRSGGKTTNVAILAHLNSIHKPLYEIASIGAVRDQAYKCYGYFSGFSNPDNEWFMFDRIKHTMQETKFRNGSVVQVLTGTLEGCNSAHPLCLIGDEVELMSWAVLQEAWCMAQSKRGYSAIQVLLSTRKFPSGNMQKLLVEKPREPSWNFQTYPWCLFEVAERCTLPDCEHCKTVLRIKEGKEESWHSICHEDEERHPCGKLRASDGYFKLQDIWDKFTLLDWDLFDAQYRCLKPGRKGLVFDTFDPLVHCKEEDTIEWWRRLLEDRGREPEQRHLKIAVVMDAGWAAPMAVLFIAKDKRDNMFLFDCIYETKLDERDLVSMMRDRFQGYNILMDFECRCDERAPRLIDNLNKLGLRVTPIGLGQDKQVGFIRQWLNGNYREGYPGVWIDLEKCYPLTVELETLRHRLDKEGNPRSELPDKGPDHLVNCWGYSYVDFGLAGGAFEVKVYRAEKPPTKPVKVPTRSDWMDKHRAKQLTR